jgi:hypothetical protein
MSGACPAFNCQQASRWSYSSDVALSHDKKTRATVVQRYQCLHFS